MDPSAVSTDSVCDQRVLATLLETSPLGIIATDQNDRVCLWNTHAESLFGYPEAEVFGRPLPIRSVTGNIHGLLVSAELNAVDAILLHRDDTPIDVSLWSAPIDCGDDPRLATRVIVAADITERKFLERALLDAVESESRRVGQELHDHLSQQLLGAAFGTFALAGQLKREGSPHAEALASLATTINDAVLETRRIARGLNPVEFDSAGLDSAVRDLVDRAANSLPCTLECARPVLLADATAALHAYRIAQEAIANAVTHAEAKHVVIRLSEVRDQVTLEVQDDGQGFDPEVAGKMGIGLSCIKYRVRALGGSLRIDSSPGSGTLVACEFPKNR